MNWTIRASIDWLQIVAAYLAVAYFGWYAVPPAMLVVGTRQHALGILGHDGAHRLICRSKRLNDLLTGLVCLWPLGVPLEGYRRFHFAHHRTVGTHFDPEKWHQNNRWLGQWRVPLRWRRLAGHIALDLFGGGAPHIAAAIWLTRPVSVVDQFGPLAVIGAVTLAAWKFGCLWVIALWFASLVTVFWAVFRLRIWTEHIGEQTTSRISAAWWQRWLFLPHNTWCHWEHHRWPSCECWLLPRMRVASMGEIEPPPVVTVGELFRTLREE